MVSRSIPSTSDLASTSALEDEALFQQWYHWGEEEANTGHYLQALRCFEEAAVAQPAEPDALLYQALCLIHLGQPQRALELTEQILRDVPHHPQGWLFHGVALHRLGRYRQ
ncbi:MAG TPA: CDC27 family protein, partial [Leptolyngbyaceae cyanobacterium M65_K2018_010]|nr:CDC27 family protein [Leptolyngbyaceae cyanobacterium M65_K2018_010]